MLGSCPRQMVSARSGPDVEVASTTVSGAGSTGEGVVSGSSSPLMKGRLQADRLNESRTVQRKSLNEREDICPPASMISLIVISFEKMRAGDREVIRKMSIFLITLR